MDNDLDISNLNFDCIDTAACFTGNNTTNKDMDAIKKHKILRGLFQLEENIHKILQQLNAYDASSILLAESNWIKRNGFSKYMPSKDAPRKIDFGQVCTVDYGKTYKGEIGYIHPGLCIGKRDGKYLIIPMTTGDSWRESCYHPIKNPNKTKEHRQCISTEGFKKDGILLINDCKFVSGGRILDVHEIINKSTLKDIQEQTFYVMFPNIFETVEYIKEKNIKLERQLLNLKGQVKNLKSKNDKLSSKVLNLNSDIPYQK